MMVSESNLAGAVCSKFQIISSLRFDPDLPDTVLRTAAHAYPQPQDSPYYLLCYHRDRLLNAAIHFQWRQAIDCLRRDLSQFSQILDTFIPDRTKPWRLRIVVDMEGDCRVDIHPVMPCSLEFFLLPSIPQTHVSSNPNSPWKVYADLQRITPSAFTTHKTTDRDNYTRARERVGIKSPQDPIEVLLVNNQGEIMEGSITTPYFRRRSFDTTHAAGHKNAGDQRLITPPLACGGNDGTTRRYALEQGFCVEQILKVDQLVDGEICWLSNGVRGFIPAVIVHSMRPTR